MNFIFLIAVIITGFALSALALITAKLLAPRSYNPQKSETYECGIPTIGVSWMQFKVGYYLYAILFLMFDIETVFLFPWASTAKQLGGFGLTVFVFFLFILVLGLVYAWKKGVLEWK